MEKKTSEKPDWIKKASTNRLIVTTKTKIVDGKLVKYREVKVKQ